MNWNKHSRFEGAHAFLGASKYSWLNYDDEKFMEVYSNQQAVYRGTRLHALAAELISLGVPLKSPTIYQIHRWLIHQYRCLKHLYCLYIL